jgi:hypothetical protein
VHTHPLLRVQIHRTCTGRKGKDLSGNPPVIPKLISCTTPLLVRSRPRADGSWNTRIPREHNEPGQIPLLIRTTGQKHMRCSSLLSNKGNLARLQHSYIQPGCIYSCAPHPPKPSLVSLYSGGS